MNIVARILMLPIKRALLAVGVPIALVELYLGVNLALCLASASAIVFLPPWILSWGLGWLAQRRLRNATPHYNSANALRQTMDLDTAIAESTKAIRIDRHNARAYTARADIYFLKGENDLAIADYTTAIQMDPGLRGLAFRKFMGAAAGDYDLAWAYFGRACVYREKGENDLAQADLEAVISISHPSFPLDLAYKELGMVYHTKGEDDSAVHVFGAAISMESSKPEYYNNRGLAHHAMGEYDLAVKDFDSSINHGSDDVFLSDAYNNPRRTYEAKGEYQLAAADYMAERMLGDDVFDAEDLVQAGIRADVAEYYWRVGQHDLSIAYYTAAMELDPDEPSHFNNRGLVYLDKGEYDMAIADFEATIAMDQSVWVAFENRDKAYVAKQKSDREKGK